MNRELIGFMAKHDITQKILSDELKVTPRTISTKIRDGKFFQNEIETLTNYLRKYDKEVTANIFFKK